MQRMRTAEGVLALIKEQDPNTEISLYFIRHLIKSGKVPVIAAGRKLLVNADATMEYIASGEARVVPIHSGIRQIRA